MVAVAHDGQHILHMVAPDKFRVRALGKAVSDRAVFPVIGAETHSKRAGEAPDFFDPDVIGLLEDTAGEAVVQPAVEVEDFSQCIE